MTSRWTENPYLKLLSFVIAVFAWGWVQGRQLVEDRVRCAVVWQLPSDLSAAEPLPSSVSLLVSGSRSAVRRAADADVKVVADLREGSRGEQTFDFSNLAVEGLPSGLELHGIVPGSVRVVLDAVEKRKLKVIPEPVGDPAAGYVIRSIDVDPSVVEVTGPRRVVAEKKSISTKTIDVSGLEGRKELTTELDLGWGITYDGPPVTVRIEIQSLRDRLALTHVPISVLDPTGSWSVDVPEVEVEIEGPAAVLSTLNQERVSVLVYLPAKTSGPLQVGLARSGARMEVVNLPPEIRVLGVRPSVVEVSRRGGGTIHPVEGGG